MPGVYYTAELDCTEDQSIRCAAAWRRQRMCAGPAAAPPPRSVGTPAAGLLASCCVPLPGMHASHQRRPTRCPPAGWR